MSKIKELTSFYEAIRDDLRIGPTHISLYMALFQMYNLNDFRNPINICRKRVMQAAKISGLATYHKCIKDLHIFGYIVYSPSFDSRTTSCVNMLR